MSQLATHFEVSTGMPQGVSDRRAWSAWQRIAFRIGLLFSLQLILPGQAAWFQKLLDIKSVASAFSAAMGGRGVNYVTLETESGKWGLGSFINWGIALLVAVVVSGIWTWFARKSARKEYTTLYYSARLVIRYWVGVNIMNYGFMKVYPNQMPLPSLSSLHTLFGEYALYRTYWQVIGLVTWYEILLGVIEVSAGVLLFFRKTAALGAVINLGVLYNVAHANFAYDGGVHLHSVTISLLSGLLLLHYVPDLWRLLITREDVTPRSAALVFQTRWRNHVFLAAKITVWVLWIGVYAYVRYDWHYHTNFSKEPRGLGLAGAAGYYQVTEFTFNGKVLPYSPLDPVRWQEVIFEDYPTLTYKVNQALPIRLENGSPAYKDVDKTYEVSGFAGGRKYYHYDLNEAAHELTLQDKSLSRGGPFAEGKPGEKPKPSEKLTWHFERPSASRIVLSGFDEKKNALHAVLDRIEENQPIHILKPVEGEPLRYGTYERRYPLLPQPLTARQLGQ